MNGWFNEWIHMLFSEERTRQRVYNLHLSPLPQYLLFNLEKVVHLLLISLFYLLLLYPLSLLIPYEALKWWINEREDLFTYLLSVLPGCDEHLTFDLKTSLRISRAKVNSPRKTIFSPAGMLWRLQPSMLLLAIYHHGDNPTFMSDYMLPVHRAFPSFQAGVHWLRTKGQELFLYLKWSSARWLHDCQMTTPFKITTPTLEH